MRWNTNDADFADFHRFDDYYLGSKNYKKQKAPNSWPRAQRPTW